MRTPEIRLLHYETAAVCWARSLERFLFRFLLLRARLHVWNALVSLSVECKLKTWWTTERIGRGKKSKSRLSRFFRDTTTTARVKLFFLLSHCLSRLKRNGRNRRHCTKEKQSTARGRAVTARESLSQSLLSQLIRRERCDREIAEINRELITVTAGVACKLTQIASDFAKARSCTSRDNNSFFGAGWQVVVSQPPVARRSHAIFGHFELLIDGAYRCMRED